MSSKLDTIGYQHQLVSSYSGPLMALVCQPHPQQRPKYRKTLTTSYHAPAMVLVEVRHEMPDPKTKHENERNRH